MKESDSGRKRGEFKQNHANFCNCKTYEAVIVRLIYESIHPRQCLREHYAHTTAAEQYAAGNTVSGRRDGKGELAAWKRAICSSENENSVQVFEKKTRFD